MSFPEFNDIGKTAKDLLEKDFNLGKTKLEIKTFSSTGVEFNTLFERVNNDFIKAELKTKFKTHGFTFTDTVTTDTDLSLKVEATELVDGAKFEIDTLYNPNNGKTEIKTGFNYKAPEVVTTTGSFNVMSNKVKFDTVLGYQKFLVGGQVGLNLQNVQKLDLGVILGYVDRDYALTVATDKSGDKAPQFSARYHHCISDDVTVALKATWPAKEQKLSIEFGTQYKLDKDASVKAKVTSAGKLDFAYIQKIRPDLKASFGLSVDTQKLDSGAHQYGFGLLFEPK